MPKVTPVAPGQMLNAILSLKGTVKKGSVINLLL